ncbi:hypothetical protein VNO77_31356 [Canavalia gladiata]|uniref:Uncharacterized protein n=1 Tax=Canavalia gladiata TaxID=3824 RepID=A0AAN9KNX2_CANGL
MGDLLGSPRVAPPPFCISQACSFGGAHAHGFDCSNPSRRRLRSLALLEKLRNGPRNRSGPGTAARRFPQPAAPILGVAAKAPKRAPEQVRSYQHSCIGSHHNSAVNRAWARVVLEWVTSWEVLVLHLLLFASVGLVLLVAPTRIVSIAQILLDSGSDPWRC